MREVTRRKVRRKSDTSRGTVWDMSSVSVSWGRQASEASRALEEHPGRPCCGGDLSAARQHIFTSVPGSFRGIKTGSRV